MTITAMTVIAIARIIARTEREAAWCHRYRSAPFYRCWVSDSPSFWLRKWMAYSMYTFTSRLQWGLFEKSHRPFTLDLLNSDWEHIRKALQLSILGVSWSNLSCVRAFMFTLMILIFFSLLPHCFYESRCTIHSRQLISWRDGWIQGLSNGCLSIHWLMKRDNSRWRFI